MSFNFPFFGWGSTPATTPLPRPTRLPQLPRPPPPSPTSSPIRPPSTELIQMEPLESRRGVHDSGMRNGDIVPVTQQTYQPSIMVYKYRGQIVYTYQDLRISDGLVTLYDADGNELGVPSGGLTGRGDGKLPNFYDEAEYLGTIKAPEFIPYEPIDISKYFPSSDRTGKDEYGHRQYPAPV